MYRIYADDILIYTPDVEELCLYQIILSMEDNSAGTLCFCMTSSHPSFDRLRKLSTLIRVEDSSRVIWKGRVISDDRNMDNIKTVQCEGKLAFLNDSLFPEFRFSGSPNQLFIQMIENHNRQVGEKQRFLIGQVTVKDKNDYIVRSSENTMKTWNAVKEKCFQSSLGGHLRIRYEAEGDYIDWLEDYQELSGQPISFGKNIIDLLVNTSAAETYTAIRPQGANVNGRRVSIADVNGGREYIVDEERAAEYGVIYEDPDESIWEDVTLPGNLLKKARERLAAGIVLRKTIEVRAIDLSLTDDQIEALQVCSYVQVLSEPHGVDAYYLLSKAELHLDAPENTQYTLGAVKAALTDTNKANQSSIVRTVERAMETAIPTDVGQLNNDVNYTTETEVRNIIQTSGAAAPVIAIDSESEDSYILEVRTAEGSFKTPNLKGRPGEAGQTAYEAALAQGFQGTVEQWLASLKGERGEAGESAYEAAVRNGYEGNEAQWLGTLKGGQGDPGKSAYEAARDNGFSGTETEWLLFLKGEQGDVGKSAYDLALEGGFTGTVTEWLYSLKGEQGKEGAVKLDGIEAKEGDILQYKDGSWQGAPMQGGGGGSVMALGYEETIAYLDSDEDKDPTGGSAVYPEILSYEDTMALLNSTE